MKIELNIIIIVIVIIIITTTPPNEVPSYSLQAYLITPQQFYATVA
jgi:hypothetical protein